MNYDQEVSARKRGRWQGRANVNVFVEAICEERSSAQRLKTKVETDIVRRFVRGDRLLDVGIGTGRISLQLLDNGLRLTGLDASAAMLERCAVDERAALVRLVQGELERLPFGNETFDTVISVDTIPHFPGWRASLDELLRVTCAGGRVIVDIGSYDHIDAVARNRGCDPSKVMEDELRSADAYFLRLSSADLRAYAAARGVSLIAVVPYGALFGTLIPNYWLYESYAYRSGGLDRLVSWIGTDPLLFTFAEFIERRIIQELPSSATGRMFVVFERTSSGKVFPEQTLQDIAGHDDRGSSLWNTEFAAHARHEPNRAFAVAQLLAAWPTRVPATLRDQFPAALTEELDRTARAKHTDDICAELVTAWRAANTYIEYHGVDLTDVFGPVLRSELRERLEVNE